MGFPIQWGKPAPRVHRLHFVSCPPKRIVYMLASPDEFVTIKLHWLPDERESAPCIGEHCPLRGLTRHFCSAYTCVLQFAERERRWMPALLGIGDPGHMLANTDFKGERIVIGRASENEGKRIVYLGMDKGDGVPVPHIAKAFDVRPHLLQRWGFFEEANAILNQSGQDVLDQSQHQQERAG